MAMLAQTPLPLTPPEETCAERARRSLCEMIQTYGLAICADPWRCEALLRDLCPAGRRETFWLIAALKENIVADIQGARESTSEAVLLARLMHKLRDNLGFAVAPAQWTAETWFEAVRAAPAGAVAPHLAQVARTDLPSWPQPGDSPRSVADRLPAGLDWRWLSLCLAGTGCALLPLLAIARVAFVPSGAGLRGWGIDSAILAAGLGLALLGEYGLMRATAACAPRRRPSPAQAAWALLPELTLLLAGPLVLLGGPLLWVGEWVVEWRIYGQPHSLAFQLGRLLQTLLLAAFAVKWADWMTRVQGRVAATLVRVR